VSARGSTLVIIILAIFTASAAARSGCWLEETTNVTKCRTLRQTPFDQVLCAWVEQTTLLLPAIVRSAQGCRLLMKVSKCEEVVHRNQLTALIESSVCQKQQCAMCYGDVCRLNRADTRPMSVPSCLMRHFIRTYFCRYEDDDGVL
jgi:hypothetical protein